MGEEGKKQTKKEMNKVTKKDTTIAGQRRTDLDRVRKTGGER